MPLPKNDRWLPVGRTLGQGGQGQVHVVKEVGGDGTEYALKSLRNPKSQSAQARFQREINVIQKLEHDEIVKILDHSLPGDEHPFYVMPIYEGFQSLDKLAFEPISRYRSDPSRTLLVINRICSALKIAHDAGVTHRDIKPDNVLVNDSDQVVLIDFGCCHVMDDDGIITLVDEGVGARYYMAPECEPGSTGDVGPASDIYSLGKLLWVLAAGRKPFSRERPAFGPSSFEAMYPEDWKCWHLDEILRQSVRRNPRDRLSNALVFGDLCRAVLAKITDGVRPPQWVSGRCTACGSTNVSEAKDHFRSPFKLDAFVFLGNANNNPELYAKFCSDCGHVSLRDHRPVKKLQSMKEHLE